MNLLYIPSWRAIALRGVLAILFGFGAFLWPDVTLTALVLLFGVYALVDGIIAVALGARLHAVDRAWLPGLEGLLGIALGLLAIAWSAATALALVVTVGVWAIATGVLELVTAERLRRDIPGEGFLAVAGVTSVLLGGLLLLFPRIGSFVLVMALGSYALVFGAAMLMLASQLRSRERGGHSGPRAAW